MMRAISDRTDEELMIEAARGERKAFEHIYDRYSGRIYYFFLKMLWQDEELANDQTQELFLKIIQDPGKYDPKRPFKTWLFSVANNMVKNIYRHREVRKDAQPGLEKEPANNEGQKLIDRKAFNQALNSALVELEPDRRAIFILRFKHELTVPEIAAITEIPEGTVKSKLFYTLKKLSGLLHPFNPRL